jgi:hypothetical protein
MKANKIIPCEIPWVGCECRYDISDSRFCNENNIFCEGNTSVCNRNYTKTTELPGGICPAPNNIIRNSDDPRCICRVERRLEPCNTGITQITITKIGGYKACKVIPEPNEQLLENTTGILNVGGYFQFKPEVDVPGGTFQTVQINNNCKVNCIGDWSEWSDCNSVATCDGINTTAHITGTRTRTYRVSRPASNGGTSCSIANNTTEIDTTCRKTCQIDCIGNWGEWSACAATCNGVNATAPRPGTRIRTYRVIRPVSNGGAICTTANNTIETDSTCQKTDCPVDCSWNSGTWSACNAITGQRTITGAIGQKTRTTYTTINPLNGGRTCPVQQTENCTIPPPITDISGTDISGNITTTVNSTDKFIIFKTGTSSFTVRSGGVNCDILMIGGGGSGGSGGGGGGAGACIVAIGHTLPSGVVNVTVGAGGSASTDSNGGNSLISIGGITLYLAKGGGRGGHGGSNGFSGGCGGGGGSAWGGTIGGKDASTNIVNGEHNISPIIQSTYAVYGNKGGDQLDNTYNNTSLSWAGGGGIGAAGGNHALGVLAAGPGGAGLNQATINGITYNFKSYFANNHTFGDISGYIGGGGGGGSHYNSTQAPGGIGGGGKGMANSNAGRIYTIEATSGATNTGSGGGGSSGYISDYSGGSGIVIIRYRS